MGHHFLCYRELQNPTGVHDAVRAFLSNDDIPDLVIIKPTVLDIYRIEDSSLPEKHKKELDNDESLNSQHSPVLHHIESFSLSGVAESVSVVQVNSSINKSKDALVLTFREAKMSIVGYDREERCLRTLSLHNFEEGSIGAGTNLQAEKRGYTQFTVFGDVPVAKVDPSSSCIAMMVYHDQLAIVPLRKKAVMELEEDIEVTTLLEDGIKEASVQYPDEEVESKKSSGLKHLDGEDTSIISRPYLVSLPAIGVTGTVKDFIFLEMFRDPTLMILHEQDETTCVGRLAKVKDTCMISVFSIDIGARSHPKIWSTEKLPFDCFKLAAVPSPIGGAYVFSPNALFYFNQSKYAGLSTNGFGRAVVNLQKYPLDSNWNDMDSLNEGEEFDEQNKIDSREINLRIMLDSCRVDFVSPTQMLISTKDGELFIVELNLDGFEYGKRLCHQDKKRKKLWMKYLGHSVKSSCVCVIPEKCMFFLGSRSGDSLLIKYNEKIASRIKTEQEANKPEESKQEIQERESKRRKIDLLVDIDDKDEEDEDDEDFLLYGSAKISESPIGDDKEDDDSIYTSDPIITITQDQQETTTTRLGLEVVDSITGCGQLTSFDRGLCFVDEEDDEKDDSQTGESENAKNSTNSKKKNTELVACSGHGNDGSLVIFHRGLRPIVGTEAALDGCRAMWTVREETSISSHAENGILSDNVDEMDSYLLLSLRSSTMILRTGEEMEPIEDDEADENGDMQGIERYGFYTNGPTLASGNLFSGKRIVQVYKGGVRLISQLSCVQELTLLESVDAGGLGMGRQGSLESESESENLIITMVDILDPYVLLCVSDGTLRLIRGDFDDLELIAEIPSVSTSSNVGITAASLFYDPLNVFKNSSSSGAMSKSSTEISSVTAAPGSDSLNGLDEDDDELALYGGAGADVEINVKSEAVDEVSTNDDDQAHDKDVDKTVYCVVCLDSGDVEIYSLPDFVQIALYPSFSMGPQMLMNTLHSKTCHNDNSVSLGIMDQNDQQKESFRKKHPPPLVADILVHTVGPEISQPSSWPMSRLVMAALLANGDILVYVAQEQYPTSTYRFQRIHHQLIARPFQPNAATGNQKKNANSQASAVVSPEALRRAFRYPMLTRFMNVNGKSGMFFRGIRPAWIFSERGQIRLLPMSVTTQDLDEDSNENETQSKKNSKEMVKVPVLCFTPFNNINCPHGFIYFHSSGSLRVCQLPSNVSFSTGSGPMVLQKLPLHQTPHHVVSLGNHGTGGVLEALQTPTYALVTSKSIEWLPDDEKNVETDEMEEEMQPEEPRELYDITSNTDLPIILENCYELRLIQAERDWNVKGISSLSFERYECVLSMKLMYLSDSATHQHGTSLQEWKEKRRPYIVVGTGYVSPEGEDVAGHGRVIVYEIDYAQYATDEIGGLTAKVPKLKQVYAKEHKQGAVTCVLQMGPYVLIAVGSKIIVHEYKNEQLVGCAFYDAQVYIVSMSSVKDFVLYGDVYKSIHFLRWKERERSLTLLAKDYETLPTFSTEFSINNRVLGLLAADAYQNLNVFHFAPQDVDSRGGQQLLVRADFHVGAQVTCMSRYRIPLTVSRIANRSRNRFLNMIATNEGSLATVVPVPELVFRRLYTLQTIMVNALRPNAGLNQREFRMYKRWGLLDFRSVKGHRNGRKGIIDGKMLWEFMNLDLIAQTELARCIGTTPEVVIQNILEIDLSTVVQ